MTALNCVNFARQNIRFSYCCHYCNNYTVSYF